MSLIPCPLHLCRSVWLNSIVLVIFSWSVSHRFIALFFFPQYNLPYCDCVWTTSVLPLKLSLFTFSTEYGRLLPGRWDDPGFFHWLVPEQQKAGPLKEGEDREAAGDGAARPAVAPGVCPYLTISGRVSSSQTTFLLTAVWGRRQQLVPRRPAKKETPTPSSSASPDFESVSKCHSSACSLLPSFTISTDSSQNRPALPQRLLWLPQSLYVSVPSCFASEALTSHGSSARLHHAVNASSCHSEDVVCSSWTFFTTGAPQRTFILHCQPSWNMTNYNTGRQTSGSDHIQLGQILNNLCGFMLISHSSQHVNIQIKKKKLKENPKRNKKMRWDLLQVSLAWIPSVEGLFAGGRSETSVSLWVI